jgi:peptidoglycan/LPS O-acetylase OafA/YrhL
MADISYPLYVVHGVLGYAVLYALMERSAHASIAVPGVTLLALFVAFLIHRLIEMPTHVVGQKLARRLASSQWRPIVERPAVETSLNSADV